MATRYVDRDADAGGNGTTNALTGANCAYVSLATWEAARQGTLSEVEECICGSNHATTHTADSTYCTISGWTTTETYYIDIKTDTASKPNGVFSPSKYRRTSSIVFDDVSDVRLTDIAVQGSISSFLCFDGDDGYVHRLRFERCFAEYTGTSDDRVYDFYKTAASSTALLINCIGISRSTHTSSYTLFANRAGWTVTVYNCTMVSNSAKAVYVADITGASIACTNVLAYCYGTGSCFGKGSAGSLTTNYCASSDATAETYGGSNNHNSHTFTFVNATGSDFHLAPGDVGAKDLGQSDPGSGLFSNDCDGVTRSGTWDVGADEYVAAGLSKRIAMYHYMHH